MVKRRGKKTKLGNALEDLLKTDALWKPIEKSDDARENALEKKYGGRVQPAEQFWRERNKKEYEHICDLSMNVLKKRHRRELRTIDSREKAVEVGVKLMGDHYLKGFASRSCSNRMAKLVGHNTDYMDFYCGSVAYYWQEEERRLKESSRRLLSMKKKNVE